MKTAGCDPPVASIRKLRDWAFGLGDESTERRQTMDWVRLQDPVEGANSLVGTQVPVMRDAKRNRSSGPLVGQGDAKFGGGLRIVAGRASEVENLPQ